MLAEGLNMKLLFSHGPALTFPLLFAVVALSLALLSTSLAPALSSRPPWCDQLTSVRECSSAISNYFELKLPLRAHRLVRHCFCQIGPFLLAVGSVDNNVAACIQVPKSKGLAFNNVQLFRFLFLGAYVTFLVF